MDWTLIPREAWLLLSAIFGGLLLALIALKNFDEKNPVWPVLIYLALIDYALNRDYIKQRKIFSYREQFVTSWFISFFVLFIFLVIFYGCGRNGC